jgi:hypothetical protein
MRVLRLQVQLALQQLESSRAQVARLEADLRDYKARAQVRSTCSSYGDGCNANVLCCRMQSTSEQHSPCLY